MYTTKMDQKYTNGVMFQYYEDLDENLEVNFSFPTHRVNVIEL